MLLALAPGVAVAAEPDEVGPYTPQVDAYDFGDEAFAPVLLSGEVEVRGVVYSPTELGEGPFPIVFVMHGRHPTCYDPDNPAGMDGDGSLAGGFFEWPCVPGRVPIPSHEGYASLGELLASHGIITVSVSANGINAFDNESEDAGAAARADLFNEHLIRWSAWNEGGESPFGGKFVGAIDLEHIGVVGHSRGGEGAAAWAAFDHQDGDPDFIDAALLLAPIDFSRWVVPNVALSVVLPYCDGDVVTLEGAHYFDDVRYAEAGDTAPKYIFTLAGTNHNYFNTIWTPDHFVAGAFDDWAWIEDFFAVDAACSPGADARLNEAEQRAAFEAYAAAFFRAHLQDDDAWHGVLRGDEVPASAAVADPRVAYHAPTRLDVNPVDVDADLAVNALGEAVVSAGAPEYALCGHAEDPLFPMGWSHCVDQPGFVFGGYFDGRQPHVPGLGQLRIGMDQGGSWTNDLPEGTDVSGFTHVQVRLIPDTESALAATGPTTLMVELSDREGQTASVGATLDALPGDLVPVLPRKLLQTVRVPLADFEDVDLTDLASVALRSDDASAALLVSDLAFADEPPPDGGTGTTGGSGGEDDTGEPPPDSTSTGAEPPPPDDGGTGGDTTGDGEPAAGGEEGCGCRSGPGAPGWLLFLLLFAVRDRKRPSAV